MKLPNPPKGAQVTFDLYVDFLGNSVHEGEYVIVGQRVGNSSRMWLGECLGVAYHEKMRQTWDRVTQIRGHEAYREWVLLIQAVRFDGYSTHWKHQWEMEEDPLSGRQVPTGKRPAPRWMSADNVVWFPKYL